MALLWFQGGRGQRPPFPDPHLYLTCLCSVETPSVKHFFITLLNPLKWRLLLISSLNLIED